MLGAEAGVLVAWYGWTFYWRGEFGLPERGLHGAVTGLVAGAALGALLGAASRRSVLTVLAVLGWNFLGILAAGSIRWWPMYLATSLGSAPRGPVAYPPSFWFITLLVAVIPLMGRLLLYALKPLLRSLSRQSSEDGVRRLRVPRPGVSAEP